MQKKTLLIILFLFQPFQNVLSFNSDFSYSRTIICESNNEEKIDQQIGEISLQENFLHSVVHFNPLRNDRVASSSIRLSATAVIIFPPPNLYNLL